MSIKYNPKIVNAEDGNSFIAECLHCNKISWFHYTECNNCKENNISCSWICKVCGREYQPTVVEKK